MSLSALSLITLNLCVCGNVCLSRLCVGVAVSVFVCLCVYMCAQGWGVTTVTCQLITKKTNCNQLLYQQKYCNPITDTLEKLDDILLG